MRIDQGPVRAKLGESGYIESEIGRQSLGQHKTAAEPEPLGREREGAKTRLVQRSCLCRIGGRDRGVGHESEDPADGNLDHSVFGVWLTIALC